MLAPVTMYPAVLSPMDGGHASNHVLFLELFAAERLKETLGREGKETFLYNACRKLVWMPLLWFLRLSRARAGWRTRIFIWQLRTPILCLSSPVRSARTKPRRRTVECRRARPTCFPIAHCCCGASDPPRHNNQRKKSQNKMGNGSGRKCCSKRGMRWLSLPQPGKILSPHAAKVHWSRQVMHQSHHKRRSKFQVCNWIID